MISTKFPLGLLTCTRKVADFAEKNPAFGFHLHTSMLRHSKGDWGDIHIRDEGLNEIALIDGKRIFSVYKRPDMPTILIITEADRSATTILFVEEY